MARRRSGSIQNRRRNRHRSLAQTRRRNEQYAALVADPKSHFKSTSTATTDKDNIKNYLSRPYDNASAIAAALKKAYVASSVVGKVIDYYQSHPTYNYTVFPVLGNKVYDVDGNMQQDFIDVAYALNRLNIPTNAPYFFKETLIDGVTYFYKIEDSTGIVYMKFPSEWCRISNVTDGVYRYRIDMSKIKAEFADSLPQELQTAYQTYTGGKISADDPKWYDSKWYMVSELGMAFTFDYNSLFNGGTAISPFANALVDSLELDKAKDNIDIKDQLDTTRLIHSKIPVDSNGEPTLDLEVAKIFDQQMRSRLPEGAVAVSSPSTITNVPLKGAGNEGVYATVNSGLEQLFVDLGVSEPLFGGPTNSSQVVKETIKKDANWIYTNLFPMLENYYNFELTQVKTKSKAPWNIKFIRESNFTLKDDIANYKDLLSYGGSRLDYLAATGSSPIKIASQLKFEQEVLDIDSLMVVKPTSNTISGNNTNNPNKGKPGRPVTDDPTDDTDRINGAK